METFLVTIKRNDGHLGVLSTVSLEFAKLLKVLLEALPEGYRTEIKRFTPQNLDVK